MVKKKENYISIEGKPFYSLERVYKVSLITVSDSYIDYKKDVMDKQFYFAYIDRKDFTEEQYADLILKLSNSLKRDRKLNLVLERRPGIDNPKQMIDFVIKAEFY